MNAKMKNKFGGFSRLYIIAATVLCMLMPVISSALTLVVVDPDGTAVTEFRWLVEEDNTDLVVPGVANPDSLSFGIHKSTAVTIAAGDETDTAKLDNLDPTKRYVISVLPDSGYTNGGALVAVGQTSVTVNVNPFPIPTAQISVLVFHDNAPLDNAPGVPKFFGAGNTEQGLEGFAVVLSDFAGQVMLDAFANSLGTTYLKNPDGSFDLNPDGTPKIDVEGDGSLITDPNGEINIKFLAPNKYGVEIVAPAGQGWLQTTTIEGKPVVDAWIKPNEPQYLVEFGPPFPHIFIGFVKERLLDPLHPNDPNVGTIIGRALKTHSLGADGFISSPGTPIPNAYIGLNPSGVGVQEYLYAGPANADGTFSIANVPPGLYQIVIWDKFLDSIINFSTVVVPDVANAIVDVGDILAPQWFGHLEGYVFLDSLSGTNPVTTQPFGPRNAFKDVGEMGIANQDVILRFRDGTVYQIAPTNQMGYYIFEEVFPWFKYLVVEVDFARFYATGMTTVVDTGGPIPADNGWVMPSDNRRNPQQQADANGDPIINPNTGNNLARTEIASFSGEVLLEAMQLFGDQSNRIDWGKDMYQPGENGGIAGMVFYATTRAEDDPRFAAGEEWEPGIARVQINLYMDDDGDGVIDDLDGDGGPTLADADNYPFGWQDDTAPVGPEDVDRNGDGMFDPGDAIQIAHTDAWDDSLPEGCQSSGFGLKTDCSEGIQTWNQVVPGVFDGGFALTSYFPGGIVSGSMEVDGLPAGMYIVEAIAPDGLEHVKEEDKNVDFGDPFTPSTLLLAPVSVGDLRVVPDELTLFPGVAAPFAGELRPLPDRKQVILADRQNAAVEFFMFSFAPKAARVVGLALDDLTNSFNPLSPTYGEKAAPPWLPIAFRDYNGKEICRVYSDEFGAYNALIPSTYTVNLPTPSGVVPQMLMVCINDPGPIADPDNPGHIIIDPSFKSQWATQCYNFDFWPGKITYHDTPVVPVGAFVGEIDFPIDCEFPANTPLIYSVSGPEGGPYVSAAGQTITVNSVGSLHVANPDFDSTVPGSTQTIIRDYSFGDATGSVTINGLELTNVTWNRNTITASVPEALFGATLTMLDVSFDANDEGFVYADDTFMGTTDPAYASGVYSPTEGFAGGGLKVSLGGIDANTVMGMSGGWQETFNLNSSANTTLSFRYNLTQSPNYEADEYSEVLVSVDGALVSTAGNSYVQRITGDGEGGPDVTTGWQQVEVAIGALSDGNHTITIGAYNNKKTSVAESTELLIDDVSLFSRKGAGMLMVKRGDNNKVTPIGITMTTGASAEVIHVVEGESIQDAVDVAGSGALILVGPGSYDEMVILWKNVKLQGSGAFSTTINARPFIPSTKLQSWRDKAAELIEAGSVDLLVGQDPTLVFDEGAGISVITKQGEFGPLKDRGRIDGFQVFGATGGGGIFVNAYASFMDITNNRIIGNLGNFAGGIRLGQRFATVDTANDNIAIKYNHITQNTGLRGGGGISIFSGADNYEIRNNFICGNFSTVNGGGIAHEGLSSNGLIADNCLNMNESFFTQGATTGGGGAGISIAGIQRLGVLSLGTGSVQINSNLIQSNLARSGDGGAIYLSYVNGQDIANSPADANNWYQIDIFNNMIVNNVTALAGAISLMDSPKVNIINNTIANNDSVATTAAAFAAGDVNSTPQPAGIVSRAYSQQMLSLIDPQYQDEAVDGSGRGFSNPVLHDNIIWHNRSFYYDPNLFGTDGGGVTLSEIKPYWDLGVLNTMTVETLDPQYGILTDLTDYNSVTNIAADPNFISEYFNTIRTAAEPTEGGNFIDITFNPLTKTGDYHISPDSPAVGNGGGVFIPQFAQLERDFDDDPRIVGDPSDSGADESVFVPVGTISSDTFDVNESGFSFLDDAFQGTNSSAYSDGSYVSTGGAPGGALSLSLGGVDGETVLGMSAAWQKTFNLAGPNDVTISFWYNLSQTPNYEADEYSEVLFSLDGVFFGTGGNDYIARIFGDGEGGPNVTTGWQQFTAVVGNLSAGDHTIVIGAYNNKKTSMLESTELMVDNVAIAIAIDEPPAITSLTATPSLISNGQTSQLLVTATGTSTLTYSWTVPAGQGTLDDSTITFPVYTPPVVVDSNIFTVTVEVSDGNNTVSDTIDITVLDNLPPSIVSAFASPPAIYDESGTGTTQLSINVNDDDAGPSPITYLWALAAGSRGTITNETTATPTYTTPGDVNGTETFTVEVQVSDGADTANTTVAVIVYEGGLVVVDGGAVLVQRPPDVDANDSDNDGNNFNDHVFLHMTAGDGFVNMADGRRLYMFGFGDATNIADANVLDQSMMAAEFPGPTIALTEGQKLYLTLTNVGMMVRPDLFDPHTIHWHGFPQAASIFDGVPSASVSINMGASFTYYYNVVEPGTYMWHCHVEATEHMQMGMLANLYVSPIQNNATDGTDLNGFPHVTGNKYIYNDGDGSTFYDVEYPIQISAFDPLFHDASELVQPLPFANMNDTYPMLNGRGYPDTVDPNELWNTADMPRQSQKINSLITATQGQKILLRISSLSTIEYYTLTTLGIPMQVVGNGSRLLRGPNQVPGENNFYNTNSVTLGGGESVDVLLDTTLIVPGTYFLYTTNLNNLSNNEEDFGGMMTEIRIVAP